jgi:hypothetical protein
MRADTSALSFDEPALYRICVSGVVDRTWADFLGGLTVTTATGPGGAPMTVLTGELADQVALSSLLNGLHRLEFTLLSVEKMDGEL